MHVEVPLHDVISSIPLRLAKLSNILAIEPRPFDPATYELEQAEYIDERGHKRVRLRDANAIRWRWAPGPDGKLVRESNTRFVRWSDGTITLAVGDEVMDAREIDVSGDHGFLFVRHPNLIQGQARLEKKLVFRPSSLTSGSHRRLAAAVDKHHSTRQQRVRPTITLVDPIKDKEDREKAEEMRIRDKERLKEQQQRSMNRYSTGPPTMARQRQGMLNADYLEEEDEEDEDDGWLVRDDLEGQEGGEEFIGTEDAGEGGEDGRQGRGMKRPLLGIEEEAEAERRLAAAKSNPEPVPREHQMHGGLLGDSEEEDISDVEEVEAPTQTTKKRIVIMGSDDEDE